MKPTPNTSVEDSPSDRTGFLGCLCVRHTGSTIMTDAVGAGWQECEHRTYGFELLNTDRRFTRFEEGLEIITRLLRGEQPVSFDGEFYRLRDDMPR